MSMTVNDSGETESRAGSGASEAEVVQHRQGEMRTGE